ncbi:hypothetical protein [Streptomyces cyaneofuscatus]|uniref:hypothetical protein n=1 Tax=Streptomyces TaxID=1883 RepID=UPI003333B016
MTSFRPVFPPRRSRAARTAIGIAVLLGVAALAWLWNGPPYPAADPDRVAVRLKAEAGQAYDAGTHARPAGT